MLSDTSPLTSWDSPGTVDLDSESGTTSLATTSRRHLAADPSRPPKSAYKFSALLQIPRRLFCPPSPQEPSLADHTAGVVRGTRRVQLKDVTLKAVLEGKHLPPLTLKVFVSFSSSLATQGLYMCR